MHIAYSAIQNTTPQQPEEQAINQQQSIRLRAYQATCSKFSKEIAAIQKYMPGWIPSYPVL
jgi:hypothetical protein